MASATARGFGRGNAPELLAFVPYRKTDSSHAHSQQPQEGHNPGTPGYLDAAVPFIS
jgi:hypothetical protein